MLEEEIDLRPYIAVLLNNKRLLLLRIIVIALGTYFLTSLISPTYKTSSIVAFIEIDDLFQFDESIVSQTTIQPFGAIPELAMSNEVLTLLLEELELDDTLTTAKIRNQLQAELGRDARVLTLSVSEQSPEEAARIANIWATVFVNWANDIFLGQGGDQVRFYEQQLVFADQLLAEKTAEWVEFQQLDQSSVISSTLTFSIDQRISYLRQVQEINDLILDIGTYRTTVESLPNEKPVPVTDQLTYFQLQSRAFQGLDSLPLIVQISGETTTTPVLPNEHIVRIDALIDALENQKALINTEVSELSPEILLLQQENAILEARSFQLQNELSVARESIRSLAYQLEAERLASENLTRGFQFASRAEVPLNPESPNRLLITVVAVALAFLLQIVFLIGRKWYQLNEEIFIYQPDNESQVASGS